MEKEMTNEMFFHLKKIYRIVIFSLCLNVACMMVSIWMIFTVSRGVTDFSLVFKTFFEYMTFQQILPDSPDYPSHQRIVSSLEKMRKIAPSVE